jgi:uncharacterized membrane protein YeaQ/YmgE (transglycosylase-associated protein family)
MQIARVIGTVVATRKHPSHEGLKLLLVQPLNLDGSDRGDAVVAVDAHRRRRARDCRRNRPRSGCRPVAALRAGPCRHCPQASMALSMPNKAQEGSMLGILGWILFGLVVGVIAKLLMPGRDPGGFLVTIGLGIAGALVAGWIGRAVGWYEPGEGAGFVMAILGAVLLLYLYRAIRRRRGPAT